MKKNNFFEMLCNANYDYICQNNIMKARYGRKQK